MPQLIEYLTAETEEGRAAIYQVMENSFQADLEPVHAEWAIARIVDGTPVAFVLVDPDRLMQFPGCGLNYGFIMDVGTRKDRRWEGHFRGVMEEAFARLRTAGISLVGCHGRYPLYRRFGFDVFTHHCGIFITPEQIEFMLGREAPDQPQEWVKVSQGQFIQDDLLLVFRTRAINADEARQVLLSAAALARQNRKTRILFEHPDAPSYGSTYPIYKTPETPLSELARACGGKLVIQGANPEEGPVPDADWLKVLDTPMLMQRALECLGGSLLSVEPAQLWLETDVGGCLVDSTGSQVRILPEKPASVTELHWPANALSQLITGYHSVEVLSSLYQTRLPENIQVLLERLFPPAWRFSRNESWTYKP